MVFMVESPSKTGSDGCDTVVKSGRMSSHWNLLVCGCIPSIMLCVYWREWWWFGWICFEWAGIEQTCQDWDTISSLETCVRLFHVGGSVHPVVQDLEYHRVWSQWVAYLLTDIHKENWMLIYLEPLEWCSTEGGVFLQQIVACEMWCHHFVPAEKSPGVYYLVILLLNWRSS